MIQKDIIKFGFSNSVLQRGHKHQTTNSKPDVDQSEKPGQISQCLALDFLAGDLSEDVIPSGSVCWVEGATCLHLSPSPPPHTHTHHTPSLQTTGHSIVLCSKGNHDQSLAPTSICSRQACSAFKHTLSNNSHILQPHSIIILTFRLRT